MKVFTRQELIEICEKAFVEEKDWKNRDSESAQCQLGECYALLKAGCQFEIDFNNTNNRTIWVNVYSKGFMAFEGGNLEEHNYYLPTKKRLEETNGKDWY